MKNTKKLSFINFLSKSSKYSIPKNTYSTLSTKKMYTYIKKINKKTNEDDRWIVDTDLEPIINYFWNIFKYILIEIKFIPAQNPLKMEVVHPQ